MLNIDLSPATAIFVYLVPTGMSLLRPALETAILDRGCRVLSYVFSVPGLRPNRVELYKKSTKLHLYTLAIDDADGAKDRGDPKE